MLFKTAILQLLALGVFAAPSVRPVKKSTAVSARSQADQTTFKFPLANGFPNVPTGSQALKDIETQAHGTLPNTPLPKAIADTSAIIFEFIAFNEIFEVAFFTDLISNITNQVPGYEINGVSGNDTAARNIVLNALNAVQAQEQLHALGANGILTSAGRAPIVPCEYKFPVDNFEDAISFASTFTDLVIGALQEAIQDLGSDGDFMLAPLLGSVVGQEGEQNALYRLLEVPEGSRIPSALPFLTRGSGAFGYAALNQMVVVPGSCPNASAIALPIYGTLDILTTSVGPSTSSIQFSFSSNSTSASATDGLSLVYVNQQNMPVVEKLGNVQAAGGKVTFDAPFPYEQYEMNGLTIAAITNGTGPFANATEVALATLFGPALIEIN